MLLTYTSFLGFDLDFAIFANDLGNSTSGNLFRDQVVIVVDIINRIIIGDFVSIAAIALISLVHYLYLVHLQKKYLTDEFLMNWIKEAQNAMNENETLNITPPLFENSLSIFFSRYSRKLEYSHHSQNLRLKYLYLMNFLQRLYLLTLFSKKSKRQEWMLYYYSLALKRLVFFESMNQNLVTKKEKMDS